MSHHTVAPMMARRRIGSWSYAGAAARRGPMSPPRVAGLWRVLRAGQLDMHRDPAIAPARHPDPAAVRLDDRPADRQSHAEPGRLGGDERLENPLALRLLETRSAVRD